MKSLLNYLLGLLVSGGIIYGLHYVNHVNDVVSIPWWWSYPVGIIVARGAGMLRAARTHWGLGLLYIDLGILTSVLGLLFLGITV